MQALPKINTEAQGAIMLASPGDIEQISEIFLESFPDTIKSIFKKTPTLRPLMDIFFFCQEVLENEFFVYKEDNQVLGYIIAPKQTSRIWRAAIVKGYVFRWFYHWISGKYDFGLRSILKIIGSKVVFFRIGARAPDKSEARILSMAVAARARGRGVGKKLLREGVRHLEESGAGQIWLEVRPDNEAARTLYAHAGFEEIGKTTDRQGLWICMIKMIGSGVQGHNIPCT
jgi:ribosomal-protein-alanine N-acetyltransferase